MEAFHFVLAAVLLIPLAPAFLLYKFLPSAPGDTDLSGPYSGLSLKLKGAFAGYFLLVLAGLGLWSGMSGSHQAKENEKLTDLLAKRETEISQLNTALAAMGNPVIDWQIKGLVLPAGLEGTRILFDDGTSSIDQAGNFKLVKRCIAKEGEAEPPKWVCIYNKNTGFNIINLNRDAAASDLQRYQVSFDEARHEIRIGKPIEINSIAKDSTVAIANFVEQYPDLKRKVLEIDPNLIRKASSIKSSRIAARFDN